MEIKQAFTAYLMQRQETYRKEQIRKEKDLEYNLRSYEVAAKLQIKANFRRRKRNG